MANDWLLAAVARGLQMLTTLHLPGAPGHETIAATAKTWTRIMRLWRIAWDKTLDETRVEQAFWAMAAQLERWPSPQQLRLFLPDRVYPPALPEPDYPPRESES